MRKIACLLILATAMLFAMADALTGTWEFTMETPGGDRVVMPVFKLTGDAVGGTWDTAEVKGTFTDGMLRLEFPFYSKEGGFGGPMKINGKLEGGQLKGTWEFSAFSGTFKAKKQAE